MLQVMARNWWMLAFRGFVAVLFGIAVFLSPSIVLATMVLLWGVYVLIDGVAAIFSGFRGRNENQHWWMVVVEGVLGVLAGIATFIWPEITALIVLYIIAAWAILTGVMELMAALQLRKVIQGEFWLALSGIGSIIYGIVLFLFPGAGILTLLWLVGIYSVAFGFVLIILSLRLRGLASGQSGTPAASSA
jgi:uncharacterized membrane protein HdeD (DUF308 family)